MFYSYNQLRSHNCLMSFVLSNRGGGKTYGAKIIGIKDWIKNGEQFMYVRRLDSELDTRQLFFDDIVVNGEFPDYDFKVVGYTGYIRSAIDETGIRYEDAKDNPNKWNVLCYFVPLSVSTKFKSTPYPLVTKIFYDEVIIDTTGNQNYLKNEPRILMELMSTVIRKRTNVRFFGMANNVSLVNPHFRFWGIKVNPNKRFTKNKEGDVIVEMFTDDDFIKEMEETPFGKLIARTEYGQYAIYNKSLIDNTAFIIDRPSGNSSFYCSFVIEGKEIGIWKYDDMFYVDSKVDIDSKRRFTITDEDHNPDYTNVNSIRRTQHILRLKEAYYSNLLFYSSVDFQHLFSNTLSYL